MIAVRYVKGCKHLNERQYTDCMCRNICKPGKIDLIYVVTKTVLREQARLRRLMTHCMNNRNAVL